MWKSQASRLDWIASRIDEINDELDDYYNHIDDEDDKPSWASQWDIRDLEYELEEYNSEYSELCLLDEYGYATLEELVKDVEYMFEWMVDPRMFMYDYRDYERVVSILKAMERATTGRLSPHRVDTLMRYPVYSTDDEVRTALRYIYS